MCSSARLRLARVPTRSWNSSTGWGRSTSCVSADLDKAIEAYREVINAAPEHAETLVALEGLFEAGTKQLEIAEILEPLYQQAGEWEKLIRVREAQLAHISDTDQRIAMYHRIAEDAEERLMDPVRCVRAFTYAPSRSVRSTSARARRSSA